MQDLGFGGGERVFQIHVFLHGDGTVGEVRVQTLQKIGRDGDGGRGTGGLISRDRKTEE